MDTVSHLPPSLSLRASFAKHHSSKSFEDSGSVSDDSTAVAEANAHFFRQKKRIEILQCLKGVLPPPTDANIDGFSSPGTPKEPVDRVVDLWHLRELALTRGGLLSPAIRRRAWPKLVGIEEHLITGPSLPAISANKPASSAVSPQSVSSNFSNSTKISGICDKNSYEDGLPGLVELTNEEIDIIKKDVGRSVWHAESHLKRLRMERERTEFPLSPGKTVKHSSPPTEVSITGDASSTRSPFSSPSKSRFKRRKSNKRCSSMGRMDEQELLLNIITSVLRCPPEGDIEDDSCDDDQEEGLHYYQGLHDIAALFLLNLESPSLTSLLLRRLSNTHLRDFMSSNFQKLQSTLRIIFMPLLEIVDVELHDYIVDSGMDESCVFCISWVLSWFGHDVLDVLVASRLLDVFLASHMLMPVYMSVAMLSIPPNREKILGTACDFGSLHMVLSTLPKDMVKSLKEGQGASATIVAKGMTGVKPDARTNKFVDAASREEDVGGGSCASVGTDTDTGLNPDGESDLMDAFEDLIEKAIAYMRKVPPQNLVRVSQKYRGGMLMSSLAIVPTIAILKPPPSWAVAATAPTDYSLRKKFNANTSRSLMTGSVTKSGRKKDVLKKRKSKRNSLVKRFNDDENCSIIAKRRKMLPSNPFEKKRYRLAIEASGLSLDSCLRAIRRKTLMKTAFIGGIAFAVVAIFTAMASVALVISERRYFADNKDTPLVKEMLPIAVAEKSPSFISAISIFDLADILLTCLLCIVVLYGFK